MASGYRRSRFADRLAVVDGFGVGQQFEVGLQAIRDLVQDLGALGGRASCPKRPSPYARRRGQARCRRLASAAIWQTGLPVIGLILSKYLPVDRRHPFAADEIVVAGPQGHARVQGLDDLVQHGIPPINICVFSLFAVDLIPRLDLSQARLEPTPNSPLPAEGRRLPPSPLVPEYVRLCLRCPLWVSSVHWRFYDVRFTPHSRHVRIGGMSA